MSIKLKINGKSFTADLTSLPVDVTLNTFIREHAGLSGTKFMCLEGGCGVCICVVTGHHPVTGEVRTWAVNSCLTLLSVCADAEITTIEGLGNKKDGYHPIQKTLAKLNGTQCGYCSPAFVMNMYGLLQSKNNVVTMEEVENSFGGNICRCTGYRPILDAMKSFAVDTNIEVPPECRDIEDLTKMKCPKTGLKCSGSCKGNVQRQPVIYDDNSQWHWPQTMDDLRGILAKVKNQKYMLVGGNTGHGVFRRDIDIKVFIDINNIPDLNKHSLDATSLQLGGNLSLTEAMQLFTEASKKPGYEYCKQLWHHFDLIANVPVRNTGTLAGNLMMKHANIDFPSDIFITFEALDAKVVIDKSGKLETVPLSDFLKMDMNGNVLVSFILPAYPKDKFIFGSYKIMPRAQNAHAYVNAAFLVSIEPQTRNVVSSRICFGGIRPEFVHAKAIEASIIGKNIFSKNMLPQLFTTLSKELDPDVVITDASPLYRKKLACGLLYKFILHNTPDAKPELKSGGEELKRTVSSGLRIFDTQKKNYPVTEAVEKVEAMIQCSGEAKYMNDLPPQPNELWGALVHATKVGATIEKIDPSEAFQIPGVVAFYSAKDIPGKNSIVDKNFGFADEEEIFVAGEVKYHSQPLGVIIALTSAIANYAAGKVKVMYSKVDSKRKILPTMYDVFEAKEFSRILDVDNSKIAKIEKPAAADLTVSGEFDIGSQYHFTMEPQTTVVLPIEEGLEVYAATQWMDMTQYAIAKMLQMKMSDVQLKVRRLGGAYGSKISRCNFVACAAALAAAKLNRPVRIVQTIESMMASLGKRWACHSEYEFHVNSKGKILAAKNIFFEDAGWSVNESPVDFHSTLCAKNCYEFKDNYKIDGKAVVTDAPSHTWCRAPGSVEGIAMIEQIIEHIAFETKLDPFDVRLENIPAGHKMHELCQNFIKTSEYRQRRIEVNDFNSKNRWRKRGLGVCIMEYPIFYFGNYPASVAIYHGDGTVVVSHGGIEMGQGLNTKAAQVAAYTLGVPLDMVKIEASDTFSGANSSVTGGAVGSESVCFAVRKSCEILNERLRPIREKMKNAKWLDVITEAHAKSINLIASDQYKTGDMQPYAVYGISLTEIELDILTGNHLIKRVDIMEDTGESISPNVDIGQIEGAFVMGLGYWLTEHLIFDRRSGELLTTRTWNYKPPGVKDIPIDFRVTLLQKSANTGGFMRSKATGEPPVCLSVGVIFAIQNALQSARDDAGLKREWVRFGTPTSPENVVLNCGSDPSQFSL